MISFSPCIVIRETFLSSLVSLSGFLISCARYAIQMAWCWRKMICSIIRNFKLITLVGNDERWKRNFSLIIYSTVHNDYKAPIKCVYGSFRVCAYYRSGCIFVLNYDFLFHLCQCVCFQFENNPTDKTNETCALNLKREWLNVCCLCLQWTASNEKHIISPETII